jgi:tripartite-type tricarboxylate transporter receptor subunit TctC
MTRLASVLAGRAFVAALMLAAALPAAAQSPEDFYKGRSIDLIISSDVGGGYDAYARLVGTYMERHIPGHPRIVPKNMVGAGGLVATNYLVNAAARDGTVFGQIQNTVPLAPLLGEEAAQFDVLKLNFIGSANTEVAVAFTWHTSPTQTFDDLLRRETLMAAATGSISALYGQAMNDLAATRIKLISGYAGAAAAFLAIERGEVDGFPAIFWSSLKSSKPDWLSHGDIRVLVQLALAKHSDLPDVPLIFDYLKTQDQREAFELLLAPQVLGRPFVAPPGLAADRLDTLRQAFVATLQDRDFLADAATRHLEVELTQGEDLEKFLRHVYATPPAIIEHVRQFGRSGG